MRKLFLTLAMAMVLVGCTSAQWAQFESGAEKTAIYSQGFGVVAEKSVPVTGIYGSTGAAIALGISTIASSLVALAKHKKAKALEAK